MKRRLLNLLTVVSLLLCLAAAALWARSYCVIDCFARSHYFDEGERTYWVQDAAYVVRGRAEVMRAVQSGPRDDYRLFVWRLTRGRQPPFHRTAPSSYRYTPVETDLRCGGFGFRRAATPAPPGGRPPKSVVIAVVPLWAVVVATAALPAWRAWRWRRGRWHRLTGRCAVCGYDLRATPDRCPECGYTPAGARA